MKDFIELFLTFAKIGGFTFGGGYAMLPMLQREVVENKHWATEEELMDYFAIGQCTPGIISVNTATFIGYKYKGVLGGIFATLGCIFPSLVIISVITACLQNFAEYAVVQHALAGIRACVCILIFNAVVTLGKKSLIDTPAILLAGVIFLGSWFTSLSTIIFVVLAAVVGIALCKMGVHKV